MKVYNGKDFTINNICNLAMNVNPGMTAQFLSRRQQIQHKLSSETRTKSSDRPKIVV